MTKHRQETIFRQQCVLVCPGLYSLLRNSGCQKSLALYNGIYSFRRPVNIFLGLLSSVSRSLIYLFEERPPCAQFFASSHVQLKL